MQQERNDEVYREKDCVSQSKVEEDQAGVGEAVERWLDRDDAVFGP
jgi:hypothetical protein